MIFSTPSRIIQPVYSASNSPKISFPFAQPPKSNQVLRNPVFYSPNLTNSLKGFKTQRPNSIYDLNSRIFQKEELGKDESRFLKRDEQIIKNEDRYLQNEEQYLKTIDYLKTKLEEILKENQGLNQMVRNFQDGGMQLHRETNELEGQIKDLIQDNERLSYIVQNQHIMKETDNYNDEKMLFQAKIDEMHDKMTLIFDDNDKLSNILREREEDFEKMHKIYDREMRLRLEVQKKYESLLEQRGYQSFDNDSNEDNRRLREMVNEQESVSRNLEKKVEILIEENEKLNKALKSQQLALSNETYNERKSLNDDNLKLTGILTAKLKEIEEYQEKDMQKDAILIDLEKKLEILLLENGKLHGIIEDKLHDLEGLGSLQNKLRVVLDEKNKLQVMLNKKNEAELFWKRKFEEIEGKVKVLFFQTKDGNF